jgi:hypothetical protein
VETAEIQLRRGITVAVLATNGGQGGDPAKLSAVLAYLAGHDKSNSGTREEEVCGLRWDWEVQVPELDTSVFIIPGDKVKNTEERLVVLNRIARSVIDSVRRMHPEYESGWSTFATKTPANLPQAPGYGVERVSEMRSNFLIGE